MINEWTWYRWTKSNRVVLLHEMEKLVLGNSKKGWTFPRVKGPVLVHTFNGESPKSVGRHVEPTVRPRKFTTRKRHMVLYMK